MSLTATVTKRARGRRSKSKRIPPKLLELLLLLGVGIGVAAVVLQAQYTFSLQSPLRIRFQWPLVIARRDSAEEAGAAQGDQCIGGPTCREPARRLRDLSLQLRRHARLGLLPDQHGAPETRRS